MTSIWVWSKKKCWTLDRDTEKRAMTHTRFKEWSSSEVVYLHKNIYFVNKIDVISSYLILLKLVPDPLKPTKNLHNFMGFGVSPLECVTETLQDKLLSGVILLK